MMQAVKPVEEQLRDLPIENDALIHAVFARSES